MIKYYLWLNADGSVNGGVSAFPSDNCVEISEAEYNAYIAEPERYKAEDGKLVDIARTQEYLDLKNTEIKRRRAEHYAAEVDPLTAEYNRKQITGGFDKGEAEKLRTAIDAATQKIKNDLPYMEAAK